MARIISPRVSAQREPGLGLHMEVTSGKKPLVLLANDDPSMLGLFSRVLELEGCRVVTAPDGMTALHLVAEKKSLALVVLNLEGAEEQGLRVCQTLRKFSDVPVIILAAKYGDDEIARGLDAGADDFIIKPVAMFEFAARVKAVLRRCGFPVQFSPVA